MKYLLEGVRGGFVGFLCGFGYCYCFDYILIVGWWWYCNLIQLSSESVNSFSGIFSMASKYILILSREALISPS